LFNDVFYSQKLLIRF